LNLNIPELCLIVLIGPSGAGKSTFARRHFKPTEILSSDFCRGLVSDDENSQAATSDAFDILQQIARKRLAAGRLTVIDATNVQPEARRPLVALARDFDVLPVAIVLNVREETCRERNQARADRAFNPHTVRIQKQQLRQSLRFLQKEGFRHVHILNSPEEIDAATLDYQPLWTNKRHERGPFDIIGDVHGCGDELERLLSQLGYQLTDQSAEQGVLPPVYQHPAGRKAVFVGDLVDRGPRVVDTLNLVQAMCAAGTALCVPGNHDEKLYRKLIGKEVKIAHGLAETLAEIDALPDADRTEFITRMKLFLDSLISHYVLDGGKLVVAHAGMKQAYQGRASQRVRMFALYGETTGETDEFGLPIRHNWAAEYRGPAMVVYGHTPVPHSEWLNNTINLDTGCVFGGKLTALRYPERELVSVPAAREYAESRRFTSTTEATLELNAQQAIDDVLDRDDVSGKRTIQTRLMAHVTIREENAAAALEVMSRFAANPKWLIYLPPTMSPCETSTLPDLLEYPQEAFHYYRSQGVVNVICQEKHMGSRAIVIICRNEEIARTRFGVIDDGSGIIYTRTGRRFFEDRKTEEAILSRVRLALDRAGFWEEFHTDWFCFDCELLPWSAKAQELLKQQYAAVGSAGLSGLQAAIDALETAAARLDSPDQAVTAELAAKYQARHDLVSQFKGAYGQYCWTVNSVDDLQLAPFHLLATEDAVHTSQDHTWHMQTLGRLCDADEGPNRLFRNTHWLQVDTSDEDSIKAGNAWWEQLTAEGGEGMVVKPVDWVQRGHKGLVQPAVKCRGREYLRIIYGPEYTLPEHIARLRARGLGGKRALALREFALGLEALERFVRREPLRRIHECVFAVLALESEPIDPRL
jgi:protein phosphatase